MMAIWLAFKCVCPTVRPVWGRLGRDLLPKGARRYPSCETIPEGWRNYTLTSLAGTMRRTRDGSERDRGLVACAKAKIISGNDLNQSSYLKNQEYLRDNIFDQCIYGIYLNNFPRLI